VHHTPQLCESGGGVADVVNNEIADSSVEPSAAEREIGQERVTHIGYRDVPPGYLQHARLSIDSHDRSVPDGRQPRDGSRTRSCVEDPTATANTSGIQQGICRICA
jgi:hypothetical protein